MDYKTKWLFRELPNLEDRQIISADQSKKIIEYFSSDDVARKQRSQIVGVFSTLAGLLIGLGVILLVSFNWNELGRVAKTILSFVPWGISTAGLVYVFFNKKSKILTEGAALLQVLSTGAGLSLLALIYPSGGEIYNLLFLWLICTLPVMYLMNSVSISALYLIILTQWTGSIQFFSLNGHYFWIMLAIWLPYLFFAKKKSQSHFIVQQWFLVATLLINLGIVMEKAAPGLWILNYSLLAVSFVFIGALLERGEDYKFSPFLVSGILALLVLGITYSCEWPWDGISWHLRREKGIFAAAVIDYVVLGGLSLSALTTAIILIVKKHYYFPILLIFPIGTIIAFSTSMDNEFSLFQPLFYNIFVFAFAIFLVVMGTNRKRLLEINCGVGALLVLICIRFFSSDLGILATGIGFIFAGIVLIILNVAISVKWRKLNEK
ncbi:MAG: DUF2157 domain-containing protein [Spirochaetales bacterium]|nr:DUF2157 domain-containing protein [Spirochaetales bacterium]